MNRIQGKNISAVNPPGVDQTANQQQRHTASMRLTKTHHTIHMEPV
uniref:Uncharacterized protein n=1 Tax=Anguilla anguilla TaxID=7936 RepID=A0A0E9PBG1_ANGAN